MSNIYSSTKTGYNIRSPTRKIIMKNLLYFLMLILPVSATAQAPSLERVYPDFADGSLVAVIDWTGPATATFEVRNRTDGGAWSPFESTLPISTGSASGTNWYVSFPGPFTAGVSYEFQFRALDGGTELGSSVVKGNSFEVIWPVRDPDINSPESFELITGFNQVYRANTGLILHEGIDIQGSDNFATEACVAPVGATILSNSGSGSDQHVDLRVKTATGFRFIQFNHLQNLVPANTVWNSIEPGQSIGNIYAGGTSWGTFTSHTHFHYWTDYHNKGNSTLNPLTFYSDFHPGSQYTDPQNNTPETYDVESDGDVLYFLRGPNETNEIPEIDYDGRKVVFGAVDIVIEAADRSSSDSPWTNPKTVGYFIQRNNGSWQNVVHDPASHYVIADNDNFLGTISGPPPLDRVKTINDVRTSKIAVDPPQNNYDYWHSFIVTNCTSNSGDVANLDADQCWQTNAISGTPSPNGYLGGLNISRVNEEAMFRDGRYRINIPLTDYNNFDTYREEILVDNFAPFLVEVRAWDDDLDFYQTTWQHNEADQQLQLNESIDASSPAESDIRISLEFSEPMKTVELTLKPKSGVGSSYSFNAAGAEQDSYFDFIVPEDWLCENAVSDDYQLFITGTDFAGNLLHTFERSAAASIVAYDQLPVRNDDGNFQPAINGGLSEFHEIRIDKGEYEVAILGGGEHLICNTEEALEVELFAELIAYGGTVEDIDFRWGGPGLNTTTTSPLLTVSAPGIYFVKVLRDDCLLAIAETEVSIVLDPTCDSDCSEASETWSPDSDCFSMEIDRVHAVDPNDIQGPIGVGDQKWVSINDLLSYNIRFENDPEFATAPAQNVYIYHDLDDNIDPFSFELGNFGFGYFSFEIPSSSNTYSTQVDVVDSLGVVVNVTAGIDIVNNRAFWVLESLDPQTGLPPADPNLGFLPVNDTLTNRFNDTLIQKGEGFVSFKVKALQQSLTGDTIHAKADIIFDDNEAIRTPEIFNTIDADFPISEITSIQQIAAAEYELQWQSSDIGSGLASYELHFSTNGSPYTLYQDGLLNSQAIFSSDPQQDYSFYVLAMDSVGNREQFQQEAEASSTELNSNANFSGLAAQYCPHDEPVILLAENAGGIFSGPGVADGLFSPSTVQEDQWGELLEISYLLAGETVTQTCIVIGNPDPDFQISENPVCISSEPVLLVPNQAGGTFSGLGVVGSTFDPSLVEEQTAEVTYTLQIGSCIIESTQNISINTQITWYLDNDNDGLGSGIIQFESCEGQEGYANNNVDLDDACSSNVYDCAGVCDGSAVVDECGVCAGNGPTNWYQDLDGDGQGSPATLIQSCEQPEGYVSGWYDFDDNCASNTYDCEGNCDGTLEIDECGACGGPGLISWYVDADGDGLGDPETGTETCDVPFGWVSNGDDIDDNCPSNMFDCLDICEGTAILDECGLCDGPGLLTWYQDADGDGLGNALMDSLACDPPLGYVDNADDTDDNPDAIGNCATCSVAGLSMLQFAPNPVKDRFFLRYSSISSSTSLSISTVTGRVVFQEVLGLREEREGLFVDIDWLPSGTYILSLDNEFGQVSYQYVVN